MNKVRCAVVGATGIVGKTFLKLLENHPYFEIVALCGSEAKAGQQLRDSLGFTLEPLPSQLLSMPLDVLDAVTLLNKNVRIVFSALPTAVRRRRFDRRIGASVNELRAMTAKGVWTLRVQSLRVALSPL